MFSNLRRTFSVNNFQTLAAARTIKNILISSKELSLSVKRETNLKNASSALCSKQTINRSMRLNTKGLFMKSKNSKSFILTVQINIGVFLSGEGRRGRLLYSKLRIKNQALSGSINQMWKLATHFKAVTNSEHQ